MCGSWSSVIPTPLSQTSMRTLSPARRHPSRIRPLSVYRTAFDNRLRIISASMRLSLRMMSSERTMHSRSPLSCTRATKSPASGSKISFSEKSLTDGHRVPDSCDKFACLAAWVVRLKRCLQEFQGLQWLSQVMACSGQKARFGAIGPFCCFPRERKLLVKTFALGNIRSEPVDARGLSGRIELDDRNLFQPDFATIRPTAAECDRMRGPVRTSTVEARCHPRLVFRMYMFQPFSPAENLLRVETEDLSCILAEPYFVGRHVPIESHNAAGPVIGSPSPESPFREASAR